MSCYFSDGLGVDRVVFFDGNIYFSRRVKIPFRVFDIRSGHEIKDGSISCLKEIKH